MQLVPEKGDMDGFTVTFCLSSTQLSKSSSDLATESSFSRTEIFSLIVEISLELAAVGAADVMGAGVALTGDLEVVFGVVL